MYVEEDDTFCGELAVVREGKPAASTPNRWEAVALKAFGFIVGVLMGIPLALFLRGIP